MKKFWRSTTMTAIMFLLALGLLSVGAIGGTQAALNIRSNNYYSAFDLDHIGVALLNNGSMVAQRTYNSKVSDDPEDKSAVVYEPDGELRADLGKDKEVKIGKQYSMPITVQNTGTIDQYVRVTIRKHWVDNATKQESDGWFHGDGAKNTKVVYPPSYIQLGYDKDGTAPKESYNSSSWILDQSASTQERQVYYYKGILSHEEGKNTSAPLIDNFLISPEVTRDCVVKVETIGDVTKTTYTYAYDGIGFVVTAEVDAVQTHHARAAMTSAWGTNSAVMTAMGVPSEA